MIRSPGTSCARNGKLTQSEQATGYIPDSRWNTVLCGTVRSWPSGLFSCKSCARLDGFCEQQAESEPVKVTLDYGRTGLAVELPAGSHRRPAGDPRRPALG